MLRAASTPAGTSIVPIAFWPRAAVAVPTVKVARSWAAARLNKTDTNMAAVIERDIDCLRSNDFGDSYRLSSYRRGSRRTVSRKRAVKLLLDSVRFACAGITYAIAVAIVVAIGTISLLVWLLRPDMLSNRLQFALEIVEVKGPLLFSGRVQIIAKRASLKRIENCPQQCILLKICRFSFLCHFFFSWIELRFT